MNTVEVLVSTMNQENLDFLIPMKIHSNIVVGNQNGKSGITKVELDGKQVILINSSNKGLSRNRNLTINNATSDICILADDDIEYCEGYEETIKEAFERYLDADIIIFNLYESPVQRYVIRNWHRVKNIEFLRYGSVRIAFKRKSILGMIKFDEKFGAGGEIPIGEDTIFLGDCLKSGLKIYASPDYILRLPPSDSTWFKGYNKEYFVNKGKMYSRIFGKLQYLLCLQDSFRHRKQYKKCASWLKIYQFMQIGAKEYGMHQ